MRDDGSTVFPPSVRATLRRWVRVLVRRGWWIVATALLVLLARHLLSGTATDSLVGLFVLAFGIATGAVALADLRNDHTARARRSRRASAAQARPRVAQLSPVLALAGLVLLEEPSPPRTIASPVLAWPVSQFFFLAPARGCVPGSDPLRCRQGLQLHPESTLRLKSLAAAITQCEGKVWPIAFLGYASAEQFPDSSDVVNNRLANARADTVRALLTVAVADAGGDSRWVTRAAAEWRRDDADLRVMRTGIMAIDRADTLGIARLNRRVDVLVRGLDECRASGTPAPDPARP